MAHGDWSSIANLVRCDFGPSVVNTPMIEAWTGHKKCHAMSNACCRMHVLWTNTTKQLHSRKAQLSGTFADTASGGRDASYLPFREQGST